MTYQRRWLADTPGSAPTPSSTGTNHKPNLSHGAWMARIATVDFLGAPAFNVAKLVLGCFKSRGKNKVFLLVKCQASIGKRIVKISGSCFCGAVRYTIDGKLRDARSCHCSMCRKAFSAQASAYASVEPEEFSWANGSDLLTKYESENGAGLLFCSICGSTLCGTYKGKVHGVTLGCVDGDPEIELGMHIFVGSKASWETIPEGVPQYEEWPEKDS